MKAGVLKGTFKVDKLDEVVDLIRREALPALARVPGFRGAEVWVNRQSGECISLGRYDSEADREAAGQVARNALSKLTEHLAGPVPQRELFDLALSADQEAQAIIERGIEAFNRGDMEQMARDSAPNIVCNAPGGMEYRGAQAVKEYNQSWRNAFPDAQVRATSIAVDGRTVVVEGEFSGTHAGTLVTPMGEIPATGKRSRTASCRSSPSTAGWSAGWTSTSTA